MGKPVVGKCIKGKCTGETLSSFSSTLVEKLSPEFSQSDKLRKSKIIRCKIFPSLNKNKSKEIPNVYIQLFEIYRQHQPHTQLWKLSLAELGRDTTILVATDFSEGCQYFSGFVFFRVIGN